MSQDAGLIERQLPNLRRYGSLLLGSRAAADDRIEAILRGLPSTAFRQVAADRTLLYEIFHGTCSSLDQPALKPVDFSEQDQRLIVALHKLCPMTRSVLLLTTNGEGFDNERVATILGLSAFNMPARLGRARAELEAALQNRLCVIVEDDLIAMRDLEAEVINRGFCVGGMAKNRTEAYGLAGRMKPDIGIIDLALPEGGLAGADIARHLRERFASKIIYVTAFARKAREIAAPGDMIVSKPWSPTSLKQAMAAVAP